MPHRTKKVKLKDKETKIFTDGKTKHETLTKAKIKRAGSGNLKCSTTNKLHRNLIVKCSEMPASF
ncbi:MAG TPA: hypothetical protein DCG75_10345 [Bacteroidales bacterium]|nr:hypothetical protein [Bacteroidales bacterium]